MGLGLQRLSGLPIELCSLSLSLVLSKPFDMLLYSQPSPSHPTPTLPAFNSPCFFSTNSIPPRTSTVLASPIKENHNHFVRTPSRSKLQVQDFLHSVTTHDSSEIVEALKKFENNGGMRAITQFNHLLISLVSADEFDLALKLESSLSSFGLLPDSWTYSIWVNCCCKKNEPSEAKTVLDQMLEKGFEPDVSTFTTLINSLCKIGRLQDAYEVFDIMSRIGCEPTIITYNCLLKGLCYVGRVEEAYELMESIKKNASMKPDIYTYTAMMDGFCKVGRSTEASELLYEALETELAPNVVTYNTLFNGYFKEGKPLRGFGVLKRMKERNCKPDYICYSTFLHGLLKWGKIRAALQIYKEMIEAGFRVDERMMNTLLRGLCRRSRRERGLLKEVYSVFEEMRKGNYTIGQGGYDLVVEAFWYGGKMDGVSEIMEEMSRIGHSPKTLTFNIAIHALCSAGEVDKALGLVLMLMHNNRNTDGIPFNLLLDKLNQQNRSLEASSVYAAALKRGVVPNRNPAKHLLGMAGTSNSRALPS